MYQFRKLVFHTTAGKRVTVGRVIGKKRQLEEFLDMFKKIGDLTYVQLTGSRGTYNLNPDNIASIGLVKWFR